MPVERRLYHRGDACYSVGSLFSEKRRSRIEKVASKEIDFRKDGKLERYFRKLTKMGIWDRFTDSACHGGKKQKALEEIATIILLGKAKQSPVDPGRPSNYPVSNELQYKSFSRLLSLLTPEGKRAMLAESTPTDRSIRLSPQIGAPRLNALLAVEMPPRLAAYWLEEAGLPGAASIAVGHAVTLLSTNRGLDAGVLAKLCKKQAELAARSQRWGTAPLPYDAPKRAWRESALYWQERVIACGNNHNQAAISCWEESLAWRAAGEHRKEAMAASDAGNRFTFLANASNDYVTRSDYEEKAKEAYEAMNAADAILKKQHKTNMTAERYTMARNNHFLSIRA